MEFSGAATLLAQPSPKQSALKALLPQSSKPKRIPHPHPKGFGFHYSDGVKSILWSPVTQPTSTSVPRLMSHFTDSDTVWHRIKSKQTDRMENTAGKTLQILVVHGILGIPDRPPNVNVQVSVSPNELMELDFQ